MEKTIIQQIEGRFLNKDNYELQIRLCVDKAIGEYSDTLNSLKGSLSNDKIKALKVLMGVNEFQTKIDEQIIELKSHYNNRLDIVGSSENKAEYIYLENEKINELITSIHKIIIQYGINKISFKSDESAIGKITGKQLLNNNDVSNGFLSSLVDFTEIFLNNTEAISNTIFNSPIFEKSTDQILVENIVQCIKKINTVSIHILETNRKVFDDTYHLNGNGFITKLYKVPPSAKTERELPKSETEIDKSKENGEEANDSKEPSNKYPLVFKNGYALEMFLELKDLTIKPTTIVADYAFIFHKMKGLGFIGKDVKHQTFIEFLNKDFDSNISVNKFPYKDQEAKKVVFSTLLEKYKHLI
jgi:hypothetical protein